MIKSQEQVLGDLKALYLTAVTNKNDLAEIRGFALALLAMATQWDVEKEFLKYMQQLGCPEWLLVGSDKLPYRKNINGG
jgi:hypothetical protein